MMNKKNIAGFEVVLLIVSMFAFAFMMAESIPNVVAQTSMSDPSECCERTDEGAWCVNAPASECDDSYASAPTSCETTSYCRTGTCYESEEGICMANTPQRVCNDNGGTWDARDIEDVPQCQMGCCVIADQAAFVPLVRCKRLSTLFGVDNDYRPDITNEVECIATAQAQDVGACVYEQEFERICEFTTRGECGAGDRVEVVNGTEVELSSQRTFYEDYLCSAEELNTACAKQSGTTCHQGDAYWTDSCGNRENIYSSDKAKSWNAGKVLEADGICNPNDGSNIDCGNCDYLLGSRCAEFDGFIGGPSDGDHYCRTNECVDRNDEKRINGESWCVYDDNAGNGGDTVGSRYFREVCIDGEVNVEPCADYRNEICLDGSIETSVGEFETAACRVNRWQDCTAQEEQEDCENKDRRDCIWEDAVTGMMIGGQGQSGSKFSNPSGSDAYSNPTAAGGFTGNIVAPITGAFLGGGDEEEGQEESVTNRAGGICVPDFPPGLRFWEEDNAQQICGQANARCVVVYEKGLIGSEKIVEGEECLDESWAMTANRVCAGLGDCGGYVNYQGTYTDDGYKWVEDGAEKEFSPNSINIIGGGFTGLVTAITGRIIGGFGEITGQITATSAPPGSTAQIQGTTYTKGIDGIWTGTGGEELVDRAIGLSSEGSITAPAVTDKFVVDQGLKVTGPGGNPVVHSVAESGGTGAGAYTSTLGTKVHLAGTGSGGTYAANLLNPSGIGATKFYGTEVSSTSVRSIGGLGTNSVLGGLQWAAVAYFAGQMIGPMIGLDETNTDALSWGMAAGFGAFKALNVINIGLGQGSALAASGGVPTVGTAVPGYLSSGVGKWAVMNPAMAGIIIGAIVFAVMYKDTEIIIVEFNCLPWQAPTGGNVCEQCNDDDLPCSEYRCKALGQSCELINPGSDQEKCVNINPRDVNPPIIRPNYNEISAGHEYTNVRNSPPGPGFNIVNTAASDGCLKAFTPLEFGITTGNNEEGEPSQCKISYEHTTSFDEMVTYVGGSNLFSYNHSEVFSLPSAAAIENSSLILENGKDLTFYIRCMDKNGNENEAEYAVNFCIDPTPDSTAPTVEATSIVSGGCIAEDQDIANVRFYTNEPAECRWSPQDQDFENMQGTMGCNNELYQANAMQLFTCEADLTGITREVTNFYVRCKDHAEDRNTMKQSYEFSLRGSTALKMKELTPNETIFGATDPFPVELRVETLFGCNNGRAICSWSNDEDDGFIQFFDTNTADGVHTQRLDLSGGDHEYFVRCVDEGGNLAADSTDFRLDIDANAPVVARIYEEDNLLKLVTIRDSECSYTNDNCDFTFAEGTEMPYANSTVHVTEWNEDKTYYIKCRDEFRDVDADCSVIVRPTRNLFD